jgi:hypothetical protein
MNSPLLAALMSCLVVSTLQAQPFGKPANRFGLGIFAGANAVYPIIRTQYPYHYKSQINVLAGVDLQYRLNSRSSLHVQPSWTQVRELERNDYLETPVLSLSTLKLPFLYRNYFLPHRKLLFFQLGGSYNYLIDGQFREEIIMNCFIGPCPVLYSNLSSSTKSAISAMAGVGVTIDLPKVSIPIILNYERYVTGYQFSTEYNKTRVKTEGFSITTGVNF